MSEQQYTPKSEKPVAVVRDNGSEAPSNQAEPKPAPPDEMAAAERPPMPRPDSRLVAAPVPIARQRQLRWQRGRTSILWRVVVVGAAVCLILATLGLCDTQQKLETVGRAYLILLALSILWVGVMKAFFDPRVGLDPLWSEVRINELYPQGAVSRGMSGTIVLPYDEVILYEESPGWLTLYGPGGVIQWAATELTPAASTAIRLYLRERVPTAAMQIKGALRASAESLTRLPTLPKHGVCHAQATAESRSIKLAWVRLGRTLARGLPLIALLAMSVGVLLCETFDYSLPLLGSPWTWFGLLSIGQMAALFLLLWWEAAANRRKPNATPEFLFCEDGLWIVAERGERHFLRGAVPVRRGRSALKLRLPGGSVRLPYKTMSDRELIFRYFEL